MNNTPKISLSLYRQGSALVRQSEKEEVKWVILKGDLFDLKETITEEEKKLVSSYGTTPHYNREAKIILQRILLTQDAYQEFTQGACPSWANPKEWNKLSKWARINAHCAVIAQEKKAIKYNFEIMED